MLALHEQDVGLSGLLFFPQIAEHLAFETETGHAIFDGLVYVLVHVQDHLAKREQTALVRSNSVQIEIVGVLFSNQDIEMMNS